MKIAEILLKPNAKLSQFNEAVEDLANQAPYFSIDAVRRWLEAQKMSYKPDTVKSYLSRQKKAGRIFDAGRGWYSTIADPYRLDTAPVQELVEQLRDAFPLLEYACWSTAQLNEILRHQLAKHVQFVYVERDAIASVADWLRESGYRPWANPRKTERQNFVIEENTVVILPLVTKSPHEDGFATIEKMLVDVLADASAFSIIHAEEFMHGIRGAIVSQRIDLASLRSYSSRRKVSIDNLEEGVMIH